ncbi:MAG: HD-GYP domain-containing protein [Gemmatimonadaceae bacterium]
MSTCGGSVITTRRQRTPGRRQTDGYGEELRELTRIGIGLMAERDRTALLQSILVAGKRFTTSDAVCLVLAEPGDDGRPRLRLTLWQCDTLPDLSAMADTAFPIDDGSVMGHAALTKEVLVVDDAYHLPPDAGFAANPLFDQRYGYWRKSMLIMPMVDHVDQLVGLLLFVNRKTSAEAKITNEEAANRYVVPYSDRDVRFAHALASHAAVSIENAELYARIEHTLESFVKASVTAIDQRDPSTAGHSLRVAALTMELAAAVQHATRAPFADVHFTRPQLRELYYAALLHDFGKITVKDDVLMKAKKLPPVLWERVAARFDLIHRTIELAYETELARACAASDVAPRVDQDRARALDELARFRRVVHDSNEPGVLSTPPDDTLIEIAARTFERPDGTSMPYLTEEELHFLQVPKGTLDDRERAEVQSHVEETYRFLADIPWTEDLKNLSAYAYGHHEKLNGTGYPRCLHGADIPIQTRMMTIADMFDALTESDRPYKMAVSPDAALGILQDEACAGRLDESLVQLLVETKAYRKILDEDWRRF